MTQYFREFGTPQFYKVIPEEAYDREVTDFIEMCERNKIPCFERLYAFEQGTVGSKWDRERVRLDRVAADIDTARHGALDEVTLAAFRNGLRWMLDQGLKPRVKFSGSSGFTVELRFPTVEIGNKYDTVRAFAKDVWNEKMGGALDTQAMMGTRQAFRVVNSVHQKTGLYAIPLTIEEVFTLMPEEIRALAKLPRKYIKETSQEELDANGDISLVLERLSRTVAGRVYHKTPYQPVGETTPLKPCLQAIVESGKTSHATNVVLGIGMVSRGYTDEQIHEALKALSMRSQTYKYNRETTQYHITFLREKQYTPHACSTLKEMGLCIAPWAKNETECVPILEAQKPKSKSGALADF